MTYSVTIYDSFFHKTFTGTFTGSQKTQAAEKAKEFYSQELDCNPTDIKVLRVTKG